jgi:hypothetical protein
VQRLIQNPLAMRMLEEEIPEGARVVADVGAGEGLEFRIEPGGAEVASGGGAAGDGVA